jgi:hypothetical protein
MALVAMMMLAPSIAHAASATLTLSSTTITFPSADPDSVPQIAANENPLQVTISVNGSPGLTAQLSVQAGGDLISGANRIPISNITWTAQGSGFVSGTLSSTSPQPVGQWIGKTNVTGSLQFWLANSWSYATGNYSQTAVYTLIAN